MREVITTSILLGFDQKNPFFEGWCWFKFNNLGLARGIDLKFYTSVAKELKGSKFWGLITTFVEDTEEKLIGATFLPLPPNPEKG